MLRILHGFLCILSIAMASNPPPVPHWFSRVANKWLTGLLPTNYSKFQSPLGGALVGFGLDPLTITAMSPKEMTMTMEMRVATWWIDNRFSDAVLTKITMELFPFPKELADQMWHPLFSLKNCKGCSEFLLITPVNELYYNKVLQHLVMWERNVFNFICQFDLSFYPFDIQTCSIEVLTDIKQVIKVEYNLGTDPEYPINVPPEYKLVDITESNCSFTTVYYGSCHSYNFILRRDRTRPILLTFFPSMLIVFLSWTSFWIECEKAPARVSLGLTTMLTLITHFNSVQQHLPAVSTIMALDVWMFSCIFIVFCSLVEFAVVTCKVRRRQKKRPSLTPTTQIINGTAELQTDLRQICPNLRYLLATRLSPEKVDKLSRVVFPVTFFSFKIIFWTYYLRLLGNK